MRITIEQRILHKLCVLCIAWVFLLLTGCAGMNSGFDCPMKPGHLCQSLDQVNRMVDQGKIGRDAQGISEEMDLPLASDISKKERIPNPISALKIDAPQRGKEGVLRIWVAPYEDKSNTYHSASVLYALLSPGYWVEHPASSVPKNG